MSKKQVVFVVYTLNPDYGPDFMEGIFSTQKLAEAAMALGPDRDYADIEEFELDDLSNFQPGEKRKYKDAYGCAIKIIGGTETVATKERIEDKDIPGGVRISMDVRSFSPHSHYIYVTSEISAEHAIQVAEESRRKYIQDNEGKLDYDPDWHLKNRFSE